MTENRAEFELRNCAIIALFTDNILHLHHNEIKHECEVISGKTDKIARNCLVSTLNCIVMQISKVICEKGYYLEGGRGVGKWAKYGSKLSRTPLLTRQKLTLAPPHLLIMLRSTPPPPPLPAPLVPSYLGRLTN